MMFIVQQEYLVVLYDAVVMWLEPVVARVAQAAQPVGQAQRRAAALPTREAVDGGAGALLQSLPDPRGWTKTNNEVGGRVLRGFERWFGCR